MGVRPVWQTREPAGARRRADPAGGAGPAADRRDRPHLRLLPRRLPQRRRPDRPRRRAGGRLTSRTTRTSSAATSAPMRGREQRPAWRGRPARGRVPRLRLEAGQLRRGHPAPDRRAELEDRRRSGRRLHRLGRLRLQARAYGAAAPGEFQRAASPDRRGGEEPGQPRARHLRQRRLPPVPRRDDRDHPGPDRREPAAVFRRHRQPAAVRVRDLADEARRVFRSRVVNPKWIAGISATATKAPSRWPPPSTTCSATRPPPSVIDDWMFERVTEPTSSTRTPRRFLEEKNPWALRGDRGAAGGGDGSRALGAARRDAPAASADLPGRGGRLRRAARRGREQGSS